MISVRALEIISATLLLGNIIQYLQLESAKGDYKIGLEWSDRVARMWKDSYEFERKLNYDIVSGKEYAIYPPKGQQITTANTTLANMFPVFTADPTVQTTEHEKEFVDERELTLYRLGIITHNELINKLQEGWRKTADRCPKCGKERKTFNSAKGG